MQRGAQSARREFGGVVLPTYVFQYIFKKSRSHAAWGGDVFPLWRSGALFSSMRRSPLGGKNGPCGDEKRSHAAWRSFRLAQERSHAAWRSFLCHGSGRSLASTWADPFFGRARSGAPMDLPKTFKSVCFKRFRTFLGRSIWAGSRIRLCKKAFPCSVALVSHFRGALPCSVALVLRFAKCAPCCVALVFFAAGALPCSAALVS